MAKMLAFLCFTQSIHHVHSRQQFLLTLFNFIQCTVIYNFLVYTHHYILFYPILELLTLYNVYLLSCKGYA